MDIPLCIYVLNDNGNKINKIWNKNKNFCELFIGIYKKVCSSVACVSIKEI